MHTFPNSLISQFYQSGVPYDRGAFNSFYEQCATLKAQIAHKNRRIKHFKYMARIGRRDGNYEQVRAAQRQLETEQFQIDALRNQRNYLTNLLTDPQRVSALCQSVHNDNEQFHATTAKSAA